MAYKRELIVNNGSLTSYKKLLKVSDVCQLLDKSKYPATNTTHGITFTNNGDGTITANGETSDVRASYFMNTVPATEGHIYLLTGVAGSTSKFFLNSFFATSTSWLKDNICWGGQDGIIFPYVTGATIIRTQIAVEPNATADNLIFKPQLYDLTEMYGAGNEPSTVAEFKAKFPNELYDYSPRCWVKSYKTGLIAETKNLFQYPTELVSGRDYSNSTLVEKLPNGVVLQGNPGAQPGSHNYSSGWFTPRQYAIDLDAEDVVTISADYYMIEAATTYNGTIAIGLYLADGSSGDLIMVDFDKGEQYKGLSVKKVVPKATNYHPVFSLNSSKVKITNIQIEKGTTATDYVPYGYL